MRERRERKRKSAFLRFAPFPLPTMMIRRKMSLWPPQRGREESQEGRGDCDVVILFVFVHDRRRKKKMGKSDKQGSGGGREAGREEGAVAI